MNFTVLVKKKLDQDVDTKINDPKNKKNDTQFQMFIRSTLQKRDRPKNSGKKKKAEEDLNMNPHIIKVRKYLENISTAEKK